MTRFVFKGEEIVERDKEGKVISKHYEFHLAGRPRNKWMLPKIDAAIRCIAGSFCEEIYCPDDHEVYVKMFSEPSDILEHPTIKAIVIEDYVGEVHQVVVVFPYLPVSEETMIATIEKSD